MMFIKKITAVKFCISLSIYHGVILAVNDTATYTPCLRPHTELILTVILLKIACSNVNSDNRKMNIFIKITLVDPFRATRLK